MFTYPFKQYEATCHTVYVLSKVQKSQLFLYQFIKTQRTGLMSDTISLLCIFDFEP